MEPAIIIQRIIGLSILASAGLAVAAWRYNRWITALEQAGHHRGYMSLLVAAGVAAVLLVALAVVWPLGPQAILAVAIVAGLFVPAGLPMICGSIARHTAARAAAEARMTAEAHEALQ